MFSRQRKVCLVLIAVLVIGIFKSIVFADETIQIFEGKGIASIFEGNVLVARRKAINEARIAALERAIEYILSPKIVEEKRDKIEVLISDNLQKILLKTEVVEEREVKELYEVRIRATVNMNILKKILREEGLIEAIGQEYKSRIMVVIPEQHVRHPIPDPAAETEIIRQLTEERFYVVDQKQVAAIRYNDITIAAAKGDFEMAAAIGRKYGAEVIVIGEAFSEYAGREKGMELCTARVEIRAIKTDTGKIIYAGAKDASALALSENVAAKRALETAASLLAPKLSEAILAWEDLDIRKGRMLTLYISGISYGQLVSLKDTLTKKILGITDVIQRSYSSGIAEIELAYLGKPQELADILEGLPFEDFKLQVVSYTENRIELEIIENNEGG